MKYVKYILITFVFIVLSSTFLSGQVDTTEYETYLYPSLKEEKVGPRYMVKTNSGIAYTSLGDGGGVYMVKLDNEFNIQWNKQVFKTHGQTIPHSMYWDDDKKIYIITGTGWTYPDDGTDYTTFGAFILKLDSLGNIIDKNIHKKYFQSRIEDAVIHKDKIFACFSEAKSTNERSTHYIACYKKETLELVWQKEINCLLSNAMTKQKDGVVIYVTNTQGENLINYVIKYDFDGNLIWDKSAGIGAGLGSEKFVTVSNQNMLFAALSHNNKSEAAFKRFDKDGNLVFDKVYEQFPKRSFPRCPTELENGDYILSIRTESRLVDAKSHIVRINPLNGEIKYEKVLPCDLLYGVHDSTNKKIIFGGTTRDWVPLMMIVPTESLNPVGIDKEDKTMKKFELCQNYPNPFNPTTTIEYNISKNMFINLSIYDINGKKIETVVNQKQYKGNYKRVWDGSNYSSGVYFYRLKAKNNVITKKMILVK